MIPKDKSLLISELTNPAHLPKNLQGKTFHTYVINGVQLMAPSRKEAEEFYAWLQTKKNLNQII